MGDQGAIPSRNEKLDISKSKLSSLSYILSVTMPFILDKYKAKKRDLVSKEFAIFT